MKAEVYMKLLNETLIQYRNRRNSIGRAEFISWQCNCFFDSMHQLYRFLFLMYIWPSACIDLIISIIEFVFNLTVWSWWTLSNFYDSYISSERMLLLRKFFIVSMLLLSLTTFYHIYHNSVRLMLTFLKNKLQNVISHYAFVIYTLRSLNLRRRFSFEYSLLSRTFLIRAFRNKYF